MLIASPSDLRDERDLVERAIHKWNAVHSSHMGVVLLPVRWETNASAEMGASAQDVINRQIVDDSDVLIGFFWTRLGTPTASHSSGTAEELGRVLDAGKSAALFVSRRPADPHLVDQDQLTALKDFLDTQRANGLVVEFQSPEELAGQVIDSLTRIVHERFANTPVPVAVPAALAMAEVQAEHLGHGNDHRLVVQNVGTGEARQVTVETVATGQDGGAGGTGWHLMEGDKPIEFLPPAASFSFAVPIHFGMSSRVNCTVRWVNPDDSEGSSRQTLSFY